MAPKKNQKHVSHKGKVQSYVYQRKSVSNKTLTADELQDQHSGLQYLVIVLLSSTVWAALGPRFLAFKFKLLQLLCWALVFAICGP